MSKVSINNQHEYITLKTPNGNFTVSYSGYKASGLLMEHFDAFAKYVDAKKNTGLNYGEIMQSLTDISILEKLFPNWNQELNVFKEGENVALNHPAFLKKYPNPGIVQKMKRKTVYIQFENGEVIGFEAAYVKRV